jgi:SP family sugar:H+ symporter-like MFS transporter
VEDIDTMYLLHIDPRKSSKWIAPPPEELITTEKLVRGEVSGTGVDPEQNASTGATAKETASEPITQHSE